MLLNPMILGDDVAVDAFGTVTSGSGLKLSTFSSVVVRRQVAARVPVLGETTPPFSVARPATQSDIDAERRAIGAGKQLVADLVNGLVPALMRAIVDYAEVDGGRGHLT